MIGSPELELGRYLQPSPAQRELTAKMRDGHARSRHGADFGNIGPEAFESRIRSHLRRAPLGFAVTDPKGNDRFLLVDPRRGTVAWITPHKEDRSTLFAPRQGVTGYLRASRAAAGPGRWRSVDLSAIRDRERTAARSPARRITSANRAAGGAGPARIP